MQILVAPDKFKGSLDALQVCHAIEAGIRRTDPRLSVIKVPMADGGEGTGDVLTQFGNGKKIQVEVYDPLGRTILADYGISADGKIAFVEMAKASGLQLLSKAERNPAYTSTVGTGQLMRHAISAGVEEIILAIGGSATNDAGVGMASALGVRFYAGSREIITPAGQDLMKISNIDLTGLDPALKRIKVKALCDVSNPLHGKDGAAYVYAKQKGADDGVVKMLDKGLQSFAAVVKQQLGKEINFRGAGAGGGICGGASAFFNFSMESGVDYVMSFVELSKLMAQCDIVITGEGKMDKQTLSGKVVKGISDVCFQYGKPLYVITGKNELNEDEMESLHIQKLVCIQQDDISETEAMDNAYALIVERISGLFGRL